MTSSAKLPAIALMAFVVFLGGCSSLTVERVTKNGKTQNGGLPYSLEKPAIIASVQRSLVYDGRNKVNDVDLGTPTDMTTFSLALIKDPNQTYAIYLKPGWFTADTQDITYNTRGGLNSFNFTSTDQTATVITTIASIASTAGKFAAGGTIEDNPQPPGSGQIETAAYKAYNKVLSDLAVLSQKAGAMSKDDVALMDSLLKEAQSMKALVYTSTAHTIQIINVPIILVDETGSIDDLITKTPADFYNLSVSGLIGIARRLQ
jgi:hypothetical protein